MRLSPVKLFHVPRHTEAKLIVNALYKQAGFDSASSHSGRRGFLTNLAEKGVSVRVMMALAGHRNMATTQRYIDLRPGVLRNAVELV